jgi:hypothetical protein
MDCNQVFMILTRGPFPTGEPWDEEVEAHLEKCADCWQLAEALRPALEVFQEAIPPAESRDLPGYWGDARPAAAVVSELNRSAARVAMAQGVRQITRTYQAYHHSHPLSQSTSVFVLRAVAIGAATAATAAGLGLLWLVW